MASAPSRSLPLRRIQARLQLAEREIEAMLVLTDFQAEGSVVFSAERPPIGEKVRLILPYPREIQVNAVVTGAWTKEASSQLLLRSSYSHRLFLEFRFENDAEAQDVRAYCEEIVRKKLKVA